VAKSPTPEEEGVPKGNGEAIEVPKALVLIKNFSKFFGEFERLGKCAGKITRSHIFLQLPVSFKQYLPGPP
jgi:hypothetical protein